MSREDNFKAGGPYGEGRAALNDERKLESAHRKALFLKAYEQWGTILKSCELADVARKTVKNWISADIEFAQDFEEAKLTFGERLETIGLDRLLNPTAGRGTDLLLIAYLNANMAAKYKPQTNLNEASARDLIAEMKSWRKTQEGTAEKEIKELSPPMEQQLAHILDKRKALPEEDETE